MAEENSTLKSILAADFGSVNTRVVLIDLVDGAYRLVARSETRTTVDDPYRDVGVGLRRALTQMTELTGRKLLSGQGDHAELIKPEQLDGSGADEFLATASAGRPLRVVLVGLMPEVSLMSGARALSGSYVEMADKFSLSDIRSEEQQINDMLRRRPDLILIVGGTDAGAEDAILNLAGVVRTAVQLTRPDSRPMVLFAGNRVLHRQIRDLMDGVIEPLFVADNVRPSLRDENLSPAQQELAAVFSHYKERSGGGFEEINHNSRLGVLPTAQSFTNIVRYLGQIAAKDSLGVLAVDVGSATTTVAASVKRQPYVSIRTDLGIGHSAAGILKASGAGNIRRWLTWDAADDEIADYIHNKTLRPASVPQTQHDLEMELALAREAIRAAVQAARPSWGLGRGETLPALSPIIGSGAVLAKAPHAGVAAMVLLDALQPVGVTELLLDPVGLIPALGAVAYLQPSAVVQMLEEGDLLRVGTAICADGRVRIGRGGMRITITLPDGHQEKRFLKGGALWTYPLPPGQTAQAQIRLSGGLSLGGKTSLKLTLTGGAAGLIFDARGRPLPLPKQADIRAQLYPRWLAGTQGRVRLRLDEADASEIDADALGKVEIVRAPETAAPADGQEIPAAEAKPKPRRGLFGRRRREAAQAAAVAEAQPDFEDVFGAPEPAAEAEKPGRRGRRGRRGKAEEEAPAPAPVESTSNMLDELRLKDDDDKKKSRRRR